MDFGNLATQVEGLPLSVAISGSQWAFPAIEVVHVLAIATVYGSILMMDMRLLGLWGRHRIASEVSSEVLPWTWVAFVFAVLTGVLMFVSNASKYIENPPFQFKMGLLALAGVNMAVFHLTTFRSIASWGAVQARTPGAARLAGGLSLLLWTGVIFLGRWIGFVDLQPF